MDTFFCDTAGCPFHVTGDDSNVQGFGDWATLEDGTTVSHRCLNGRFLCDLCAQARVVDNITDDPPLKRLSQMPRASRHHK